MIKIVCRALTAAGSLGFLLLAHPASAQFNPFHGNRYIQRLTSEDFRMLNESATRLNTDPQVEAGQSERWNNPRSGASGTVTVTRVFRSEGLACHALRYVFHVHTHSGLRTYNLTWCQPPGQDWKIKS